MTLTCGGEETERGAGENRVSIDQLGAGVGRVLQTCSRRSSGMGSGREEREGGPEAARREA